MWILKRIIKCPVIYVCIIVLTLLMIIGCCEDLSYAKNNNIGVLYCFVLTNSLGVSHVVAPLLVSIPFLYYYVDEIDHKYTYYQIIRANDKVKYYGAQILSAIITVLIVTIVSILCFTILCLLLGATWEPGQTMAYYYEGTFWEKYIVNGNSLFVYMVYCVCFVLYALPWPLVGIMASYILRNRYVIVASPFIAFVFISYITQLLSLERLDPGLTLLKGSVMYMEYGGVIHSVLYNILLTTLFIVIIFVEIKMRYKKRGI
ncbi:MAG: hypothetical protein J6A59_17385 [Lachnospiraceae bacterium]|nr:hypothetical protein [Lachnospiraceae bacterium]MBR3834436.1 hypothetical protein [Lachnospiraceae bacterium]